jgi:hypothetical protein
MIYLFTVSFPDVKDYLIAFQGSPSADKAAAKQVLKLQQRKLQGATR